ncbi:hypothetical protein [Nocardia cerradoensis]|uniref:hypothetical protein n=1 Tax=Nocardia cerradoensis TaxID=85688 RepID=UPI00167B4478|nr:hypothetical protein [Nocardia cerradoensis]
MLEFADRVGQYQRAGHRPLLDTLGALPADDRVFDHTPDAIAYARTRLTATS